MDYNEIVAAAKAYSDRLDNEVSVNMGTFIVMAESRINRVLKISEQTHRVYTKTVAGKEFYTLPPEYNGMRFMHLNTGEVDEPSSGVIPVDYVTPEQLSDMQASGVTSGQFYTILNNQIQLHPTASPDGTIEMVFYRKVPPLSANNQYNWMSIDYPDIYLSGICAEIELFVKNYEASQLWDTRMTRSIEELKLNDSDKRWAGNTMIMRIGE